MLLNRLLEVTRLSPNFQEGSDVFLGAPLLVLGILAGLVAVGFAFYSAIQVRGGKTAGVFWLSGVGLLCLDIGVVAVTFFEIGAATKVLHDVGLMAGFVFNLLAYARLRGIIT